MSWLDDLFTSAPQATGAQADPTGSFFNSNNVGLFGATLAQAAAALQGRSSNAIADQMALNQQLQLQRAYPGMVQKLTAAGSPNPISITPAMQPGQTVDPNNPAYSQPTWATQPGVMAGTPAGDMLQKLPPAMGLPMIQDIVKSQLPTPENQAAMLAIRKQRALLDLVRGQQGQAPISDDQWQAYLSGQQAPANPTADRNAAIDAANQAVITGANKPAAAFDPMAFYKGFTAPQEGSRLVTDPMNGAASRFGINQKSWPGENIAGMTSDRAGQIFSNAYAAPAVQANLPPALAAVYSDTAFMSGPKAAQAILQASGGDPQKYLDIRKQYQDSLNAPSNIKAVWDKRTAALGDYVQKNYGGATPAAAPVASGAPTTGMAGQLAMADPDLLVQMGEKRITPFSPQQNAAFLANNPNLKPTTYGTDFWGNVKPIYETDVKSPAAQAQAIAQSTAAANATGARYGAPVTLEVNDGKGGTKQVLAVEDKQTSGWVTADGSRTPINAQDARIIPTNMVGGGRSQVQLMRITNAANEIAPNLENLARMPVASASSGFFGTRQLGGSLFNASLETLTNKVTSQDVQTTRALQVGIGRNLAYLESAGGGNVSGLANQFDRLLLQDGDTYATKILKLAQMRQDAEQSIQGAIASPNIGRKQIDVLNGALGRIQKAIPWTVPQAMQLTQSNNPQASLKDFATQATGGGVKPPAVGTVQGGYRFKGGNPADQNNWMKL